MGPARTTDALVIGGGLMGVSAARELTRHDLSVCVVERGDDIRGEASRTNSGIVHTGFDATPGTLESRLVVAGNPLFDRACKTLDVPFRRCGALMVATTEAETGRLEALFHMAGENGVYDVELVSGQTCRDLEPALTGDVSAGLLIPGEAVVDPLVLLVAQAENAVANGAKFVTGCEVTGMTRVNDGFRVETTQGEIAARLVVNAAGLQAARISGYLGITDFTMRPRRGELLVMPRDCPLSVDRIILPVPSPQTKGKLYSPTPYGTFIAGPTAEDVDDESDRHPTSNGVAEIEADLRRLLPGFDRRDAIKTYVGLRPVRSPDGYSVRVSDGFAEIAGIRSTGVSSCFAVARYLTGLMAVDGCLPRRRAAGVIHRFGIPRTADMPESSKRGLMESDPGFGAIVCKCESVSQAEILEAIHRSPGARSVDGVKRRVRAGMGPCQGRRCHRLVEELLAREQAGERDGI